MKIGFDDVGSGKVFVKTGDFFAGSDEVFLKRGYFFAGSDEVFLKRGYFFVGSDEVFTNCSNLFFEIGLGLVVDGIFLGKDENGTSETNVTIELM